jgi:large subunit ribosomal protein L17
MRHKKMGRQFGRNTSHRRAMLRGLTANLVANERIETTDAKAKELRRVAERLITRAVRLGPVAYTPQADLGAADRARRQNAQQRVGRFLRRFATVTTGGELRRIDLVEKLFLDLARRFRDRPGGYTRIVKIGRRRGDNAPMSLIEFVDRGEVKAKAADDKQAGKKKGKTEAAAPTAETASEKPAAKAKKSAAPAAGDKPVEKSPAKRAKKTKTDGE